MVAKRIKDKRVKALLKVKAAKPKVKKQPRPAKTETVKVGEKAKPTTTAKPAKK